MSMHGMSEWACGESERIAIAPGRVYALTGLARATRGDVFLQISFWRGSEWLGMTVSDSVATDGEWQECRAVTEPARFPAATEVSISGTTRGGNVEAWFARFRFAVAR